MAKKKKIFSIKNNLGRLKVLIIFIFVSVISLILINVVLKQQQNIIPKINTVNISRLGDVYAFGYTFGCDILAYNTKHEVIKLISTPCDDSNGGSITAIEYYNNKLYVARESGIQYIDLTADNYKLETWIDKNLTKDKNALHLEWDSLWIDSMHIFDNTLYYEKSGDVRYGKAKISLNETDLAKSDFAIDELPIRILSFNKKDNIYYFKSTGGIHSKNLISGDVSTVMLTDNDLPRIFDDKMIYNRRDSYYTSLNEAKISLYVYDLKTRKNTLISKNAHESTIIGNNVYYINYGENKLHKYNIDFKYDRIIYENTDKTIKLNSLENVGDNLLYLVLDDDINDNKVKINDIKFVHKYIDLNGKNMSFIVKNLDGTMKNYDDKPYLKYIK